MSRIQISLNAGSATAKLPHEFDGLIFIRGYSSLCSLLAYGYQAVAHEPPVILDVS